MERQTRQRAAILQALQESGRSLSPVEIQGLAQRGVPGLSLSTVYRQIKGLQQAGEIATVELPGQPDRYELPLATLAPCPPDCHAEGAHHHDAHGHVAHGSAEERHRHHFHCTACDEVTPIEACPGGIESIAPVGWRVERHDITLHGRCGKCLVQTHGSTLQPTRSRAGSAATPGTPRREPHTHR
jgi:Fur family ferric uptake transcriptional regulator